MENIAESRQRFTGQYYPPGDRDAAIEALEARNANLQRTVVKLLENRIRICPQCRERHEVTR